VGFKKSISPEIGRQIDLARPTQNRCIGTHNPPPSIKKLMAYLKITLRIAAKNRPAAAEVYSQYKGPFLTKIADAKSKELLIRDEDVQVLHGFDSVEHAQAYPKAHSLSRTSSEHSHRFWTAHPKSASTKSPPKRQS